MSYNYKINPNMLKKIFCVLFVFFVFILGNEQLWGAYKIKDIQHASKETCNGSIDIVVDGNTGAYTIEWEESEGFNRDMRKGTTSVLGLCEGVYRVQVTMH